MSAEGGFLLIWFVMFIVFSIILPWWTYTDAKKKGYDAAILWALLVFFTPLVGLVLYFLLAESIDGGNDYDGSSY